MIIPVKCFTCGKVLGDKYRYYQTEVRKAKLGKGKNIDKVVYLTEDVKDNNKSSQTDNLIMTKKHPILQN